MSSLLTLFDEIEVPNGEILDFLGCLVEDLQTHRERKLEFCENGEKLKEEDEEEDGRIFPFP